MGEMAAEAPVPTGEPAASPAETVETGTPVESTSAPEVKTNPAWQPILDVLPTSLHGIVAPTLKEWDRGVQERFRELHGQYDPLKPYEQFSTAGVAPEDIAAALGLIQQIEADPRSVWESMGSYYNLTPAQQAAVDSGAAEVADFGDPYTDPGDERINKLEETLNSLTNMLMSEREQNTRTEQDRAMETELSALKDKYGEYDREFVLTQMAAGLKPEDAVKSYSALVDRIKTEANRPPAPVVVGGGAGGVSAPQSVSGMTPAERRATVAQMLANAKNQS